MRSSSRAFLLTVFGFYRLPAILRVMKSQGACACHILRLLIGSRFPKSLRASLLTVCISCGFLTEIRVVSCSVCQLPLFTLGHLLVLKKERFSDTI